MDVRKASAILREFSLGGEADEVIDEAILVVLARLNTIDQRAQQIRGGAKQFARPPEVVDFMLAEPPR